MVQKWFNIWMLLLVFAVNGNMGAQTTKTTITGLFYKDLTPVEIGVEHGKITSIKRLEGLPKKDDFIVSPGFIDLQINGYAGISFTDEGLTEQDVQTVTKALWKEGVTTYLPTIITAYSKRIKDNLRILDNAIKDSVMAKSIPGFFLEGPYISPLNGFRGVHDLQDIRQPIFRTCGRFPNPVPRSNPKEMKLFGTWIVDFRIRRKS